jgi:hypothetical protein
MAWLQMRQVPEETSRCAREGALTDESREVEEEWQ